MNRNKLFTGIWCALVAVGIAAGAGIGLSVNNDPAPVTASEISNNYVYFIPNSDWIGNADKPRYALYTTVDGVPTWYDFKKQDGASSEELYYAELGQDIDNIDLFIFVAMDPENLTNGFGIEKWNQSADITRTAKDVGNNIFHLDNGWDYASGSWSGYFDRPLFEKKATVGFRLTWKPSTTDTVQYHAWSNNTVYANQDSTLTFVDDGTDNGYWLANDVSCAMDNILFHVNNYQNGQTVNLQLQPFAKTPQAGQVAIFTCNGTDSSYRWTGGWGLLEPVEINPNYARIWFSNNENGTIHWYDYLFTLHYWDDDGTDIEVMPTGWYEMGSQWLAAFDVLKTDLVDSNMQFKIYDPATGAYSASTVYVENETVYRSGDNNHIYYLWVEGSDPHYSTEGGLNEGNNPTAEQLKPVLEAYYTCLNDLDNGFANIDTLKATWHMDAVTGLETVTIDDYADEDTNYDGGLARSTTLAEKIAQMEAEAKTNSQVAQVRSEPFTNNDMIILLVVVAIAASAIALLAIYSIKRRKEMK